MNLQHPQPEGDEVMKKRILGCLLSAVSVYLTMIYLTNFFLTFLGSFSFNFL